MDRVVALRCAGVVLMAAATFFATNLAGMRGVSAQGNTPGARFSGQGKAQLNGASPASAAHMRVLRKLRPPLRLSPAERLAALDGKTAAPYATLAPGRMTDGGKARAEAWLAIAANSEAALDATGPYISFWSKADAPELSAIVPPGIILRVFNPTPGAFYLLDCAVTPATYSVSGPGGALKVTLAENKHLLLHLDQADKGWYSFAVGSDDQWGFYSCDVIRLD